MAEGLVIVKPSPGALGSAVSVGAVAQPAAERGLDRSAPLPEFSRRRRIPPTTTRARVREYRSSCELFGASEPGSEEEGEVLSRVLDHGHGSLTGAGVGGSLRR